MLISGNTDTLHMKISLGSNSIHKLQALKEACKEVNLTVEGRVRRIKTSSGQNEQPVGLEETFQGALTRAMSARVGDPDSFAIGIESGIIGFFNEGVHRAFDITVVVIITPEGRTLTTTSSGIQFPEKYVQKARRRGFKNTTVGTIIAEELGGDPSDPHSTLTKKRISRQKLLKDALVLALSQI